MTGATAAERARPRLVRELARLRALLEAYASGGAAAEPPVPVDEEDGSGAPLDRLAGLFGLTAFERDALVLAAAVELDGGVAALVSTLQGGPGSGDPRPTFGLALSVLPGAHWDALSPERPLRRWRLVELGSGPTLATRPLAVDEQVLHALTGIAPGDGPLSGVARDAPPPVPLAPAQERVADELAGAVATARQPVLVCLGGDDGEARVALAQRLAAAFGRTAHLVDVDALPDPGPVLAEVARLVDRSAVLTGRLPVLVTDGRRAGSADPGPDRRVEATVSALAQLLEAPLVVVTAERVAAPGRLRLCRDATRPTPPEQRRLWHRALAALGADPLPPGVAQAVEEIAQHYRLGAAAVHAVAHEWAAETAAGAADGAPALRRLCRERSRVGLDGLAERVEVKASWDDLVLPEGQVVLLRDLARQVRHRTQVYERWGLGERANRGLGVTALFAGESGTGKTMAAEVVANDLGLDLYRIDLSAVVSKYIGETEKNLRRVFEAAETGGAVLLFDEADALFARRSEVRDSHDRYANLEVAYLLQRMEAYSGLAVLTTNLRSNVDRAFLRRLRFVVQFPFPDEALRAEIWRRAFPARTPVRDLEPAALARLQVSGGSIRAVAVAAAFAAADAGTPVGPEHVLHAARVEYAKAERPLTDSETAALTQAAATPALATGNGRAQR